MIKIQKNVLAEEDMVDIWLYSYGKWGEVQADLYIDSLDEGISRLAENPELGTDCSHIRANYRRIHVGHHMIYYTAGHRKIDIIRVLHERMDPDKNLHSEGIL
jgi:toxin ParE1/3/4